MADGKGRQAASGVRIRQDVEAFRVAASRLGLVGPGPAHGPVAIELAPPASEEAIAAVEAEIGRRLPGIVTLASSGWNELVRRSWRHAVRAHHLPRLP
ncbi:hypothetical protein ACI2KH_24675, partial [Roseomonas mucosa]